MLSNLTWDYLRPVKSQGRRGNLGSGLLASEWETTEQSSLHIPCCFLLSERLRIYVAVGRWTQVMGGSPELGNWKASGLKLCSTIPQPQCPWPCYCTFQSLSLLRRKCRNDLTMRICWVNIECLLCAWCWEAELAVVGLAVEWWYITQCILPALLGCIQEAIKENLLFLSKQGDVQKDLIILYKMK